MSFVATWMDLEIIIFSEVSQTKTDIMASFICGILKMLQMNLFTKQKKTDSIRNQIYGSVHFSSVTQSGPTLCDPMNHSTPGLSVHHQLPEFTQTHIHRSSR